MPKFMTEASEGDALKKSQKLPVEYVISTLLINNETLLTFISLSILKKNSVVEHRNKEKKLIYIKVKCVIEN